MRMGDPKRQPRWCSLWLCLLLLCAWPAMAMPVVLQSLPMDLVAEPDGVLSGDFDDRLQPPRAPAVVRQRGHALQWWRVTTPSPLAAEDAPKLLLHSPFLYTVEAWAPGVEAPTRHALYGEDADFRYSHRALVIDLPNGIPAGAAVWLRIESKPGVSMPVSIEALDDVKRADLAFVAWRAFILAVLTVLVLLALAFWAGTGERSYGWFAAMLCFAVLYIVSVGGDVRGLPGADVLFGGSPRSNRFLAGLGIICSNFFQRTYLDLPRKLPVLDRLLWLGTGLAVLTVLGSLFSEGVWVAVCGNLGLLLSAALLLAGSAFLAWRGDRVARVVVLSWLPLMTFTVLVATEMMGLWVGPGWLSQGLAGSFALAGLLLTIGLADKLLQLRRDRDQASAMARADELTGLLNRAGVEEALREAIASATRRRAALSIAFVDLDNFKQINDEHGHAVGDQCLRIVSMRLRNQLRGPDIMGRYGGDEFLVVLPNTSIDDALAVAGRMLAAINCRPLTMDDMHVHGTLSIGVAELGEDESVEAVVQRADRALYASKAAGRNCVSGATVGVEDPIPA